MEHRLHLRRALGFSGIRKWPRTVLRQTVAERFNKQPCSASDRLSASAQVTRGGNYRRSVYAWRASRAIANRRNPRSGPHLTRRVAPTPAIKTRHARRKCSPARVVRNRPHTLGIAGCPTPGSRHDSVNPIRRRPHPPSHKSRTDSPAGRRETAPPGF